jgi:hypothetical protein
MRLDAIAKQGGFVITALRLAEDGSIEEDA